MGLSSGCTGIVVRVKLACEAGPAWYRCRSSYKSWSVNHAGRGFVGILLCTHVWSLCVYLLKANTKQVDLSPGQSLLVWVNALTLNKDTSCLEAKNPPAQVGLPQSHTHGAISMSTHRVRLSHRCVILRAACNKGKPLCWGVRTPQEPA